MKHGKLIFTVIAAAALAGAAALSGCTVSIGTDGRDGQDVSIREIFEETNAARLEQGLDELTFLEFVSQYLSYDGTEAEQMTSLQAAINRSLLSSVQVTADFGSEGIATGSGVIIQADREAGDIPRHYGVVHELLRPLHLPLDCMDLVRHVLPEDAGPDYVEKCLPSPAENSQRVRDFHEQWLRRFDPPAP